MCRRLIGPFTDRWEPGRKKQVSPCGKASDPRGPEVGVLDHPSGVALPGDALGNYRTPLTALIDVVGLEMPYLNSVRVFVYPRWTVLSWLLGLRLELALTWFF